MRITWYSNAPWAATGYGQQTAAIVPRLVAEGHEVAIAANYGLHAAPTEWEGLTIFPAGKDRYSNDIANAHHQVWGGDWLITLYDVWPLEQAYFKGARIASWVPIDHQPAPPEVVSWCRTVRSVAMSRFGQRMLAEQGINAAYIPHSIDTAIFRPTEAMASGKRPRDLLNVPHDAFLVGIFAANQGVNPPRKAWPEMFAAASYFLRQHPDAHLYVHTDQTGIGGLDLPLLAQAVGMPDDRLHWADAYAYASGHISQDDLAALYSACDVRLAPSMGEGFGIPVIEAQACGVPVIVSAFSAQPELVGAGWTVKGQAYWDPMQAAFLFTPFIASIVGRLEEAYSDRGSAELRDLAIAKAAEYDTDLVFDRFWRPFLRELEASLAPAVVPDPPRNRAERRRAKKAGRAA